MIKKIPGIEYDLDKRWEGGAQHHPKSIELLKRVDELDWELLNGCLDFKTGGDGDIGETLMYLMDIYFEESDKKLPVIVSLVSSADIHRSVIERLAKMTETQLLLAATDAGIFTKTGKLTKAYKTDEETNVANKRSVSKKRIR